MIRVRVAPRIDARYEGGDWTVAAPPGLGPAIRALLEADTALALVDYSPAMGDPEGVIVRYLEAEERLLEVSLKLEKGPEGAVY